MNRLPPLRTTDPTVFGCERFQQQAGFTVGARVQHVSGLAVDTGHAGCGQSE